MSKSWLNEWAKTIDNFNENVKTICPHCNNELKVNSKIINKDTTQGYIQLWCEKCKKGFSVSLRKVKKERFDGNPPMSIDWE